MKALIHKALIVIIASITLVFTLGQASAWAQYTTQLEEKALPVGEFNALNVTGDFEVSLEKGACGVKVTTDKVLAPYLQVYVRARVLYISYDSKSVPKDVRKLFRGRNSPQPVFRAVVTLPDVSAISLSDDVSLNAKSQLSSTGLEINLTDKAQVKNLWVGVKGGDARVNMNKNALADLNLTADSRIDINTDGSAELKLIAAGKELLLNAGGSADNTIDADVTLATLAMNGSADASVHIKQADKVVIQPTAASDLILSGEALETSIRGDKNSEVIADDFTTKKLSANLSGSCRVSMGVEELIDASLVGGSALYYTGNPVFRIGKIVKSTLAPVGASAK